MRLKMSNFIWGVIFILIGVGFAGNAFNLWSFDLFFDGWWTLFIIVPCGVSLVKNGFRLSNLTGLLIGLMLLLSSRNIIDSQAIGKLIVPFIFVLIGINLVFKNLFKAEHGVKTHIEYQGGSSEHSAVFAGATYRFDGEKFMGTTINAVFGGVDIDLRNAIIDEDIVINATAIFGGIDMWVPSNVRVKVSNVPIFGGVDNKAAHTSDPNSPTIYVNSTCMFGGIDIK